MQHNLMKKTAAAGTVFFVAAMSLILYLSFHRVVTITGVAQDEIWEDAAVTKEPETERAEGTENHLTFQLGEADTSYLRIPLPEGTRAEEIMIENHYMDREIWVLIPNGEDGFYREHVISGNREAVEQGIFDVTGDGVRLKFTLKEVYECHTILENENLYIDFLKPKELYDKIIVIDAACGGSDSGYVAGETREKDITLRVARKLKEKLDEGDIKAYYTRMDDINPTQEDRIALGNETRADMYIRIQVSAADDAAVYGTEALYNGDYFIPGFGSVELADYLEREVVTSIKGKALGLVEAGAGEYTLRQAVIPAAAISVGYITNPQEVILLGREEYAEKIASGIYNAILKIYEEEELTGEF